MMKKILIGLIVFGAVVFAVVPLNVLLAAESNAERSRHAEAQLVAEKTSVQPGTSLWVGLSLKMDTDWHTYWKNPGDSGLSTTIDWKLPDGFIASDIHWPFPNRFEVPPIMTYGYGDEILLLTKIEIPKNIKENKATISADVDWLECEVNCFPGSASLSFDLPVSQTTPEKNKKWIQHFEKSFSMLPVSSSDWNVTAEDNGKNLKFKIYSDSEDLSAIEELHYFSDSSDVVDHPKEQVLSHQESFVELNVPRSKINDKPIERAKGIFVRNGSWLKGEVKQAMFVDVPNATFSSNNKASSQAPLTLLLALVFAFFGGLILNLMPCVLPVLSLKILSFVDQANQDPAHVWRHGASFTAGVMLSFAFLATLLISLRFAGQELGWGFQMQSPGLVLFLTIFFLLFTLNLFGVFEIGASFTSLGSASSNHEGLKQSFVSGIIATVVATPCTAPFMGAAVGFSITQPPLVALTVFLALGFGMAFPYLFLSLFPSLLRFVPKPGPWMITMKKVLGILIFATTLWLIWVLGYQLGLLGMVAAGFSLLFASLAVWWFGRAGSHKINFKMAAAGFGCVLLAIIATRVDASDAKPFFYSVLSGNSDEHAVAKKGIPWRPYSDELIRELKASDQSFFINFTAKWCLSCQVNDRLSFQSQDVVQKFKELGIVPVKADWTTRDELITQALARYERAGIPLYVFYKKGLMENPVILPELLTPGMVIEAIEQD